MKKFTLLLIFVLCCVSVKAQDEFITTWKPGNHQNQLPTSPPFPSSDTQAWAPFRGTNYTVYWEEVGYPSHNSTLTGVTSQNQILLDFGTPLNPIPSNATYTVKVTNGAGNFHRVVFKDNESGLSDNSMGDFLKITEINQWGSVLWSSMNGAFTGCLNLNMTATDTPNLTNVTDMAGIFSGCTSLIGNATINNWDISEVTNLSGAFTTCILFDQPLGNWNTAKVQNMGAMFLMCQNFNQPIGNWNTSQVIAMDAMFNNARKFNQPIGNWNVSNVAEMEFMFSHAWAFNQPIGNWNVSGAWQMNHMFLSAKAFNQPIGNWNTSAAVTMEGMFYNASSFNQPLSSWNTTNVVNMATMFQGALAFNQNISTWNTSQVTFMQNMFAGASSFNQNLGTWNLGALVNASGMLQNSGLNCQNYDKTLYGWNLNPTTPNGINISSAAPLIYTHSAAVSARNNLINAKGWTITGDSYDDRCESVLTALESTLPDNFSIYPNPASDFIYVKNLKNGLSYKIYDVAGRLIVKDNLNKNQIDIRSLSKGNYILQIIIDNTIKSLKIVKK
ncbi:BspA family leucine-rich repeat surface protein [Chryseobacterium zhengzhouense]|uniref:BspA family leucine-rich repeat surface protein n=1 Tax=Chryseobacterium zhengzhouense TaxID=1636086 RepID=A0ABW2LU95_9FLAO